jgi:predicted permease
MRLLVNMGITAVFTFVFLVAIYFIGKLCLSFSQEDAAKRVCVASTMLANCGFMGIPIMQTFFPGNPEPVIYATVFTVVSNALAFTLGIYAMSGDRKYISAKKAFLNPPTVALIVALPLFFIGVVLPAPVLTTVDYISNMSAPISMLIMGIRLAQIRFADLFKTARVYATVFIRLILSPLFALGVMLLLRLAFQIDGMVITVMYIILAMPVASTTIAFAEMLDSDVAVSVKCTLLSTMLCVVTIPVLMLLTGFI